MSGRGTPNGGGVGGSRSEGTKPARHQTGHQMMKSVVIREDGARGSIVADSEAGRLIVQFDDGARIDVERKALVPQADGTYRLVQSVTGRSEPETADIVIPVVAEELTLETEQVARSRVRVSKRVESREETVDAPTIRDDVVIKRVPVNKYVEGEVPTVRDENGVLVIPLIEEVTVVEKRLLIREEVHVSRHKTTTSGTETVVLRREVVDVERDDLASAATPSQSKSQVPKE